MKLSIAAAVQSLKDFAAAGAGTCHMDVQEVEVSGDWAFMQCSFTLQKADGTEMTGK